MTMVSSALVRGLSPNRTWQTWYRRWSRLNERGVVDSAHLKYSSSFKQPSCEMDIRTVHVYEAACGNKEGTINMHT